MSHDIRRWWFVLVVIAAMTLVCGCTTSPLTSRQAGDTEVSGDLIEFSRNGEGGITTVALRTDDAKQYVVVKEGKGLELTAMVGKRAELVGHVRQTLGKNVITVHEYRVLN